ncbi:1,2-phenylacetyl-CoA epoxidase subunit PaaD [uncultured Litoreibacter sp.]|uniref:1,2-phenylacetyl-CoA epoxidase subunit PaaD n=1 Tax=uncultured Litoreibacter sp. TaxID=1392394 RepID=UPI00260FABA5|nr:1,2-phenylacetyl-CoA epoxidase subunit PaaD [uncultured Litoreibacter sp.]
MTAVSDISEAQIWTYLESVPDPEIPVISIVDLGVVRSVEITGKSVEVTITPTYSGCPAMAVIAMDIETGLAKHGITDVHLKTQIAPPWTTDWLSEKGLARLADYGIAAPQKAGGPACCPRCQSKAVERVSQFGSTPCKAQWRCTDCLEPFDYFKCI